jgi:acyl-lipid omega-3 desaturase
MTHKNHHKNTGNMDKDEAYYPFRDDTEEQNWTDKVIQWAPGIIWFRYLLVGYSPRNISHFNPVTRWLLKSEQPKLYVTVSLFLFAFEV